MVDKKLYLKKMKAQLDIKKAELDKLRAKTDYANADARLRIQKDIESLERTMCDLRKKLSDINDSGSEAWKSIREGADSSWELLKTGIKEAQSRFKK